MTPAENAYLPRDFDIFSLLTVRREEVRLSRLLVHDVIERASAVHPGPTIDKAVVHPVIDKVVLVRLVPAVT